MDHVINNETKPALPLDPAFTDNPDIVLAGLQLWIHGRQFPDIRDGGYDDWLWITAEYQALGASVSTLSNVHRTDVRARPDGLPRERRYA